MKKIIPLTELPKGNARGLLGFPLCLDLDNLDADIAILGVPYGLPYYPNELSNDQSTAPDILRLNAQDAAWEEPRTLKHFDWDLGGPLLDNKEIKIVDCGNVTADFRNPREHYKRAEEVARRIFSSNITVSAGILTFVVFPINSSIFIGLIPVPGPLVVILSKVIDSPFEISVAETMLFDNFLKIGNSESCTFLSYPPIACSIFLISLTIFLKP